MVQSDLQTAFLFMIILQAEWYVPTAEMADNLPREEQWKEEKS